ncbi:MAG TPA: hypothetical protein VMM80_04485 [Bacteroidota bacterium]|nr:hypothetical protein [Bacteroidota bacterium]
MEQAYTPLDSPAEHGFGDDRQKAALQAYRREEFMHLTPEQVIYKVMSLGVQGCRKQDRTQAVRAVNALILALDFKYREVAMGLFRLYDYTKTCIYDRRFDEALEILEGLRGSWAEAFHIREAA